MDFKLFLVYKMEKNYFVHESSYADEGCEIGEGTKIWHFCHVSSTSKIGKKCSLGQNVFVAPEVVIGNNVKIQNNVSFYTGVVIEDDVFCGPSMVFTNVLTPRSAFPRNSREDYHDTLIKKGASIGANATIVCGNTIGSHASIGAGAVVTKDIPDFALCYGNPARVKGWVCECGIKLEFKENHAKCACNREYNNLGDKVEKL